MQQRQFERGCRSRIRVAEIKKRRKAVFRQHARVNMVRQRFRAKLALSRFSSLEKNSVEKLQILMSLLTFFVIKRPSEEKSNVSKEAKLAAQRVGL